ncbi:MAG: bifunctional diaminohydroxyphosphoribosylaminopyrimidine deaminase/5-amino-6-(5-phosphoribosylamino)uracil reductase RibD [Actinobacteria bacterium]|nr:bifunctional diaminohydroxyphosphoribosylaminopyrimidine deaminase/5-amino-6-(5-phosphoribosylamino)uracil reductase RibD [Actinomycetota bacterium]
MTTSDDNRMRQAIEAASSVRRRTSPNPWVGSVIECVDGRVFVGATEPPGGRHGEIVALHAARDAGADVRGATVYTTLEPCSHHGRTGPCAEALIEAGVARVVSALEDPDTNVAGRGHTMLRAAGLHVDIGCLADEAHEQLRPYLHHRRTGRPFVVSKLAASMDGRTAAADGSSRWITGEAARAAVHALRADSDAIVVGAGTVRADDPELTTRLVDGPSPRRIVLGSAPADARVRPCLEWTDSLESLLDHLGADGVLQLMVEGGATVASSFYEAGLVDRHVLHLAPAFLGASGRPLFAGPGAATIDDIRRGRLVSTRILGDDVEIVIDSIPAHHSPTSKEPT